MDASIGRAQFVAIVRDKLGRIVIDESVLLNSEKLTQIVEAVRGSYPSDRDPKRDC